MLGLLKGWGFTDADIVFIQHLGTGARVRGRGYVHRPGAGYGWLGPVKTDGGDK